ncbi:Uncharacterized protein dnl_47740 [Desulfonema limicola]|uniref:Uncharacterized protein n=1 Tax=Desulfonema limicola TaxID=45656 RepID=A0A975BB53_9BACT|nr:Uncharacterized protein dnl_47740 [Desulfonema limicola]
MLTIFNPAQTYWAGFLFSSCIFSFKPLQKFVIYKLNFPENYF